jgi:hypothetical protein
MKKTCVVLSACFLSLFCLLSCGLEAFYYIDYIPNSDMQDTTLATIRLPSSSDEGYSTDAAKKIFDHFIIFYRIYISDIPTDALIASTKTNDILINLNNWALNSDYAYLYSFTDKTSTTVSTANLENTFLYRKYFKLELENAEIIRVLGSGSLGTTITISFPLNTGIRPTLNMNGASYILLRDPLSIGPNASSIMRGRNFLNHPELYNPNNAIPEVNADVAKDSRTSADFRYTYVSMYIAAVGKSLELPPRNIYSQPTFIGVFRLAESS